MKIERLSIKNIGMISNETIELNKPLIIFFGEIRQGKTTILNAVRWVCGGKTPTDIIKHGQREAAIELQFAGGSIGRRWYVGRDGATKADEIKFIRNGREVDKPANEIKKFLNPFLLNQDHLREMGETDRKTFFADLFAIDTTELDDEAVRIEVVARDLRSKIKGYGDIDLTPVKAVDTAALKTRKADALKRHAASIQDLRDERAQLLNGWKAEVSEVAKANQIARDGNNEIQRKSNELSVLGTSIKELRDKLMEMESRSRHLAEWLEGRKIAPELAPPAAPDTSDLDARIAAPIDTSEIDGKLSEAAAQQVRVEQYIRNKERDAQRQEDQKRLNANEKRLKEIKLAKTAKLKDVSDQCGIADLAFDESGNFTYQATSAGMLSTAQIMKLSTELSAMYPEGFGLELLDRGESLGRSIFEFVERAKERNSTILATVVGERPAQVPEEVGVFVVEEGCVIGAEEREAEASIA